MEASAIDRELRTGRIGGEPLEEGLAIRQRPRRVIDDVGRQRPREGIVCRRERKVNGGANGRWRHLSSRLPEDGRVLLARSDAADDPVV